MTEITLFVTFLIIVIIGVICIQVTFSNLRDRVDELERSLNSRITKINKPTGSTMLCKRIVGGDEYVIEEVPVSEVLRSLLRKANKELVIDDEPEIRIRPKS